MNDDANVNLADWTVIAACLSGPDSVVSELCDCADGADHNGHVDLRDMREMLFRFRP